MDLWVNSWDYPLMIKPFLFIFLFALLWLYFYFHHHYVLVFKFKKQFKFFINLLLAKKPEEEIGEILDKQLKKAKNPQIKNLYRSFSALVTAPVAARENAAQKHKREIDYFLAKRELQIKGLAIVLIFSMAGLVLMEIKVLSTVIDYWYTVNITPKLSQVLSAVSMNFHFNLFQPLALALAETFLVFWLINHVKKLLLWLDCEWAILLEIAY